MAKRRGNVKALKRWAKKHRFDYVEKKLRGKVRSPGGVTRYLKGCKK